MDFSSISRRPWVTKIIVFLMWPLIVCSAAFLAMGILIAMTLAWVFIPFIYVGLTGEKLELSWKKQIIPYDEGVVEDSTTTPPNCS